METNKKTREILDIHTHKNVAKNRHSIVNYPLLPLSPFRLSAVESGATPRLIRVPLCAIVIVYNLLIIHSAPLFKGVYYSVGIHPWESLHANMIAQLKLLKLLLKKEQVLAIGEAGLDKSMNVSTNVSMEAQMIQFMMQIDYAEKVQKPMIIHCVRAMEELLAVKRQLSPKQPWIWHGFRGKPEQAQQLLDHGFYLSFGENYQEETMAMMPADRLFLETDDSEADIECLLRRAAEIRGVEPDILRETLYENAEKVFFKGQEL